MGSRERLLAALDHREPDQAPVDFSSTPVSGIHVTCVAALRDHYGLEKRLVKIHEPYQMLGWLDEDLKQAMGIDVEGVFPYDTLFGFRNRGWKPWKLESGLEVLVPEDFRTTTDANGDTLIYPKGDLTAPPSGRMPKGGHFFDTIIRQPPLDEDKLNPEDNLEEFGPVTEEYLEHLRDAVPYAASTGRGVMMVLPGMGLGDIALVPGPFMKHPKGIRDVAEWYMSTATRRDYIHAVFARQTEISLANLPKIHAVVGDAVDVVMVCGTDFGTQASSFCSEATFRELYVPYYQQVNGWIHRNTRWKTLKHSCGSVVRFLSAFVDAGFDVLNPVQCSAAGMEPERLKSAFGDKLVFWGGGVDTQKTLPFETPEKVREQVLRRCEVFAPGGGFVFNAVHNIQAGTPVANIVAMLDGVREFNGR